VGMTLLIKFQRFPVITWRTWKSGWLHDVPRYSWKSQKA